MIGKKATENHPRLPGPDAFGWTFDVGSSHFSPVRCLNPPAPEAVGANVDAKEDAAVAKTISHVRNFADAGYSVATTKLFSQG